MHFIKYYHISEFRDYISQIAIQSFYSIYNVQVYYYRHYRYHWLLRLLHYSYYLLILIYLLHHASMVIGNEAELFVISSLCAILFFNFYSNCVGLYNNSEPCLTTGTVFLSFIVMTFIVSTFICCVKPIIHIALLITLSCCGRLDIGMLLHWPASAVANRPPFRGQQKQWIICFILLVNIISFFPHFCYHIVTALHSCIIYVLTFVCFI